jgi:CheY-like chemotaxis protein
MLLQFSPPRVLVVDDDAMSRELLTVLLEAEGYAVDSADSGEKALARLSEPQRAYDVILTDLQMPGLAGAKLGIKLRHASGPLPLLLAISGSQPIPAEITPFDGFLLKPFPMDEVATALLRRASRSRKESQSINEKSRAASPKIRTPSGPINLLSIAASAAQPASNTGMNVSSHEQNFHEQQPQSIANSGTPDLPVLNDHIYRQLSGSMPTPQLQEMYALCVNDARQRIARMRTMIAEHDSTQFVREAHSIKGGCGMLGATELHRMAATLESCGLSPGEQGETQNVNSLDELCAACDRLERMLGSRV